MIILNLKNYAESTGSNLLPVLQDLEAVIAANPEFKDILVAAPAAYDLHFAQDEVSQLTLAAQHVDAKGLGSTTGWLPAAAISALGVKHAVLNHSEHRFSDWALLEQTIVEAQQAGLKLTVCCENLDEAQKLLALKPFAIAFEDKDLIGSGQSITTGRPEDVKAFIALTVGTETKAIIGAGISNADDVKAGLEFGAAGFILASAFVKAADRQAKAIELATPFLTK